MSLAPDRATPRSEQGAVAALIAIKDLIHARERLGAEDAVAVAYGTTAGALSFLEVHLGNAQVRAALLSALKACDARMVIDTDVKGVSL